ncbi:hypothetical protein [Streptomyces scabiei]|uniref:hypothetical protein n=1 Tax=Streptomyces scabiei TaxID=1930 RepID=UPI0029A0C19B|nr:hypothetical protein [Streptomyces scabiei]MDX3028114.1 hypothetical protein [Streptomyces scabiei]
MNIFPSLVRTLVPYGVGAVLAVAAVLGLDVSEPQIVVVVTAVVTGVYYTVFRVLEALAERIAWEPLRLVAGVLLGWARPPQYVAPITAPVRLRFDRAAMDQDVSDFVRRLGAAAEERGPR